MRRIRYPYTLCTEEDEANPQDAETLETVPCEYLYPDYCWPEFQPFESEPVIPFYYLPYPLYTIPNLGTELFSSVTSFYSQSFQLNPYEEYECIDEDASPYLQDLPPPVDSSVLTREIDVPPQEVPGYNLPGSWMMVTDYGTVAIYLRHLVRVDISTDGSVYVSNIPAFSVVAFGGSKSCIIHPNGRVFNDGAEVHILTLDRRAKITKKGVIFTSSKHCLAYRVDDSGTKTTAEKFKDLSQDFSGQVFYLSKPIPESQDICQALVDSAEHRITKNGEELWIVGGLYVKQNQWGDVRVSRNHNTLVEAFPTTGRIRAQIGAFEADVSRYPMQYLVVRRGNQHVTASLRDFTVQNGTQKAGFNSYGKLVLK